MFHIQPPHILSRHAYIYPISISADAQKVISSYHHLRSLKHSPKHSLKQRETRLSSALRSQLKTCATVYHGLQRNQQAAIRWVLSQHNPHLKKITAGYLYASVLQNRIRLTSPITTPEYIYKIPKSTKKELLSINALRHSEDAKYVGLGYVLDLWNALSRKKLALKHLSDLADGVKTHPKARQIVIDVLAEKIPQFSGIFKNVAKQVLEQLRAGYGFL